MIREGGCLCGAVRYRLKAEPLESAVCHCETCRRTASAPSLPYGTVPRAAFVIGRGQPIAFRSSPHVARSFCGTCGTALTYENTRHPDTVDVMTCSLDDPDAVPPTFSVWVSEALGWDRPPPDIPAFPRSRAEGLPD